jgi:hypothetical protein
MIENKCVFFQSGGNPLKFALVTKETKQKIKV